MSIHYFISVTGMDSRQELITLTVSEQQQLLRATEEKESTE